MRSYEALPLWAQGLFSFIFVGVPLFVLAFFVAYFLNQAYYG